MYQQKIRRVANATAKRAIKWLFFVGRFIAFSLSFLVLSYIAIVVFDTVSGKLNSIRFNSLLRVGMSRLDETAAETLTHADLYGTLSPSTSPLFGKKGVKFVWFTSWGRSMRSWRPNFVLQFDDSNRLQSWRQDDWVEGC